MPTLYTVDITYSVEYFDWGAEIGAGLPYLDLTMFEVFPHRMDTMYVNQDYLLAVI